jgi:ribosome maturation factor RimP
MDSEKLRNQIALFMEENLESPGHFLVQVNVGMGKVQEGRVQVLVDSDTGITIAECAGYSRKLGKFLDEGDFFSLPYHLEVASPGLDFPLNSDRQFLKNIGRKLLIDLKDGKQVEGKLLNWNSASLELETEEKIKGKKAVLKTLAIASTDIVKAKVTVSFK